MILIVGDCPLRPSTQGRCGKCQRAGAKETLAVTAHLSGRGEERKWVAGGWGCRAVAAAAVHSAASILSSRPQLEEVAVQSHHNSCSPMLMRRDETDNQLMFTKWRGKEKKNEYLHGSAVGIVSKRLVVGKESRAVHKGVNKLVKTDL